MISILASACPLLLCSIGALFTEYAGVLALFMDGLITFSAFLTYSLTIATHSSFLGLLISSAICSGIVVVFGFIIEKCKGQFFIAAIAMNLLFSSLVSFLSWKIFGTRGVLTSPDFVFGLQTVYIATLIITVVLLAGGICFLIFTRSGIYIRIAGLFPDVLLAKGGNPALCRLQSWGIAAVYASIAGGFLVFRLSSFVPNISSGRGWMALAAVFLGKKNPIKIVTCVIIFCLADIFAANIQNFLSIVPSSLILSFPYIVALLLISFSSEN